MSLPSPRRLRVVPALLLVAVVAVAAYVVLRPAPGTPYVLELANASQIVKGAAVRIGGVQVGTTKKITLDDHFRARVEIAVDPAYVPLRQGTNATVRAAGIGSIAGRYVDLSPGPTYARPLPKGAVLPVDRTTSSVEFDQLFDTLDPKSRDGLRKTVHGFAAWYRDRGAAANLSTRRMPTALEALERLSAEVAGRQGEFRRFLTATGRMMGVLATEPQRLTEIVSGARRTVAAVGAESTAVGDLLRTVPATLNEGTRTLRELRASLPDVQRVLTVADGATRTLPGMLGQLRSVAVAAKPVVTGLRQIADRPGPGNDAVDLFRTLPGLAADIHRTAPRTIRALDDVEPIFAFIRPYVPDTLAWMRGLGGAAATYDANGHYVRTLPVFGAFDAVPDTTGALALRPKALGTRGSSPALSRGNVRRCPGGAGGAATTHVDDDPRFRGVCDPAQAVGGP